MDNINFQGRTVLITSPKKYAQRMETIKQKTANILYCSHVKGMTRKCDVNDGDIFVFVYNGKDGALRKIGYERQLGAKAIIDNICEDIQNFGRDLKENITCIILGGRSNDSVSTKCTNDIANRVEKCLSDNCKEGDISIISGVTDELTSPIFIDCNRGLKIPEIYLPTKLEGNVTPERLEDTFDIVELNNIDLVS